MTPQKLISSTAGGAQVRVGMPGESAASACASRTSVTGVSSAFVPKLRITVQAVAEVVKTFGDLTSRIETLDEFRYVYKSRGSGRTRFSA